MHKSQTVTRSGSAARSSIRMNSATPNSPTRIGELPHARHEPVEVPLAIGPSVIKQVRIIQAECPMCNLEPGLAAFDEGVMRHDRVVMIEMLWIDPAIHALHPSLRHGLTADVILDVSVQTCCVVLRDAAIARVLRRMSTWVRRWQRDLLRWHRYLHSKEEHDQRPAVQLSTRIGHVVDTCHHYRTSSFKHG